MSAMSLPANLCCVFELVNESNLPLPVHCPSWGETREVAVSLGLGSTVALGLAIQRGGQAHEHGHLQADLAVSFVCEPGRVCIDDTFGHCLVLHGSQRGLSQRLTMSQFQTLAWIAFHGDPAMDGQNESLWKQQLADLFCDSSECLMFQARFVSRIKTLIESGDRGVALAHQLGVTEAQFPHLEALALVSWWRILSHDDWHRIVHGERHVGFIASESLHIGGSARVELHGLQIYGTRASERALMIRDNADVKLVACEIFGNGNGVYVGHNASLELDRCVIRDCGSTGLVVAGCSGQCRVRHCQISRNHNHGVALGGQQVTPNNCVFHNTSISHNWRSGMSLFEGASAAWQGPASYLDGNREGRWIFQEWPVVSRLEGFQSKAVAEPA